jgi:hypothetical protein
MTMTPLILPRPPRRLRGRLGGRGEFWFGRLFTLPHVLVGIGATGYLLFVVLWRIFGAVIPGVVTGSDISHSSKGGTYYSLKYQYQVGGQTKSGSAGVSQTAYERFQSGNPGDAHLTVRYFSIGPFERAALNTGGMLWSGAGLLFLWVGCWDLAIGVAVYQLWIKPLRLRGLFKHGLAAPGRLLSKRMQSGKSTSYYCSYTFDDPVTGSRIEAETQVWDSGVWERAAAGQPVTVLYAPDNPQRSTIYESGGYLIENGTGATG